MADSLPWYKDGLRFQCTSCGKCCTGKSGFVWVTDEELTAMALFLKIPPELFKRRYTRLRNKRLALAEKKEDHSCIFLKNNLCQVYGARPRQCQTFPWWPENLKTKESWELLALECEGISDDAPVIPCQEITAQLEKQ